MNYIGLILIIVLLIVILELGARIYYKKQYLMPCQPKNVGEYPFKNCIEEVDAPLIFRFRKNFNSPNLNFNRFGLRGPEPAPDGDKKRILILGESDYFGAKLPDERDLWSVRLQKILSSKGHAD